jgi:hypothetical protein
MFTAWTCVFEGNIHQFVYMAYCGLFTARTCVFEGNIHQFVYMAYCGLFTARTCVFEGNIHQFVYQYMAYCGLFTARTCVFERNIHQTVYIWLFAASAMMFYCMDTSINIYSNIGSFRAFSTEKARSLGFISSFLLAVGQSCLNMLYFARYRIFVNMCILL